MSYGYQFFVLFECFHQSLHERGNFPAESPRHARCAYATASLTACSRSLSISYSSIYSIILISAAVMRLKTTYLAISDAEFSSFLASTFETLHSHPAQSSIGYDVVWTTISFVAWVRLGIKHEAPVLSLVSVPIVSVGVIAPYVMRLSIGQRDEDKVS